MDWLNYTLNLLSPTTVVNNVVVGLILAIVGLISGIISGMIVFKYKWKKAEELKQNEKLEQEQNKRREELKGFIKKHNEDMINLIIKYWFHENERINEERHRTIEHLQEGYPDIWKLECECDDHKNHFLESEKSIRSNIKDKLKQHAPFEWANDFGNMEQLLYKAIENFSVKGGTDEEYKIHLHNFGLFGIRKKADQNDKYLMKLQENYRKLVDNIVDDKTVIEQFKFISQERTLWKKKTQQFKQHIEDIKHNFEKWGTELEGTCKECKPKHDEFEFLK